MNYRPFYFLGTFAISLLSKSRLSSEIPIYLLTDRPSCFTFLNGSMNNSLSLVKVSSTNSSMSAKLYKTTIFKYLPKRPDITNVLYLDIDIRANKNFNEYLIPTFASPEYSKCSVIGQKERYGLHSPVNSGTLVLHRNSSRECLYKWGLNIKSGKYRLDQHAFMATKECIESVCYLPDNIVFLVKSWKSLIPTSSFNLKSAPLLHYTSNKGTKSKIEKKCKESPSVFRRAKKYLSYADKVFMFF